MSTTPDYAGAVALLELASTDLAGSHFSAQGLAKAVLPAIRTLLESSEALERERTNLIETKREQIGRLQKERDEQWKRADTLAQQNAYHKDRAEAAEAERDRLAERVAELERGLEPFAKVAPIFDRSVKPAPQHDDDTVHAWETVETGHVEITVGHLRTARSLVNGGGDE